MRHIDLVPCVVISSFRLLDCVCYSFNEDFIILRFVILRSCSVHFTIMGRLRNFVHYTKDFVM